LDPAKYYVTEISYDNTGRILRVVDANLASGHCGLPFRFPSIRVCDYMHDFPMLGIFCALQSKENYQLLGQAYWATFVNCSHKFQDQTTEIFRRYQYIPCLSGKNTFVYGFVSDEGVRSLRPSCSILSLVPTDFPGFSEIDIFQHIQKGFTIAWGDTSITRVQVIQLLSDRC